jgi:ferrous iron transport protein A
MNSPKNLIQGSHAPEIPLSRLSPGEVCEVVRVEGRGVVRQRLLELGVIGGTRIRAVRPSPLGDPMAFEIRGSLLALRREETCLILVRRIDSTHPQSNQG